MKLKMLNKTGMKMLVVSVMALSLISIPVYASGTTPTKKVTANQEVNTSVKVSTQGTYTDKDGGNKATIMTPKATGKVKGLDILNKNMAAYTKKVKTDYLKDKENAPEGKQSVSTTYKMLTNTKTTLAIQINTTVAMAGSNSYSKYFTLDKATGKILTLKDLFKKDADYVTVVSNNLIEQMNQTMDRDESKSYFIQRETDEENMSDDFYFSKIKEEQEFYLNKKGNLVIAFDKYEAAPGYMGEVKFEIPNKVIADILK